VQPGKHTYPETEPEPEPEPETLFPSILFIPRTTNAWSNLTSPYETNNPYSISISTVVHTLSMPMSWHWCLVVRVSQTYQTLAYRITLYIYPVDWVYVCSRGIRAYGLPNKNLDHNPSCFAGAGVYVSSNGSELIDTRRKYPDLQRTRKRNRKAKPTDNSQIRPMI